MSGSLWQGVALTTGKPWFTPGKQVDLPGVSCSYEGFPGKRLPGYS